MLTESIRATLFAPETPTQIAIVVLPVTAGAVVHVAFFRSVKVQLPPLGMGKKVELESTVRTPFTEAGPRA